MGGEFFFFFLVPLEEEEEEPPRPSPLLLLLLLLLSSPSGVLLLLEAVLVVAESSADDVADFVPDGFLLRPPRPVTVPPPLYYIFWKQYHYLFIKQFRRLDSTPSFFSLHDFVIPRGAKRAVPTTRDPKQNSHFDENHKLDTY